jgi:class 3 adenylate cyclase
MGSLWFNYWRSPVPRWYNCSLQMAEERAERRLAAILAADVVGYSRLMERDEAPEKAVN